MNAICPVPVRPATFAFAFASLALLTGCAGVIPVPVYSHTPSSGQKVEPEQVHFIRPGRTTRAELTQALGTNFCWIPRARALAYSWEMPGGGGVWWITTLYGGDAGYWVGGWRGFLVAFDDEDRVAATAFKKLSTSCSLDENVYRWARSSGSPRKIRDPRQGQLAPATAEVHPERRERSSTRPPPA